MSRIPRLRVVAVALLAVLVLAGCSGQEESAGEDEVAPEEVLTQAKQHLDDTTGLRISLSTEELPAGVQGVVAAEGVATHAPAFDGSLTVVFAGTRVEVPVIAVDGTVHAQIPLIPGWSTVDPAEYGAPDPADLMAPESGLSSLLSATRDVRRGESVRGGEGNREVLTEYSGTVPAATVSNVIPSATGEPFEATYTVTEEGELREATLTGEFYPGSEQLTYTLGFSDYGVEPKITAP